jgi:2,5-diketo-D-gluconate reductase B
MMAMTTLRTVSGKAIHPIGIGTWGIASRKDPSTPEGRYGRVEPVVENEETEIEALQYSLAKGQNHIDCAELYGAFYTDEVVGRALSEAGVDRADLFIADKIWKTSVGRGKVRPTVEQMLRKLKVDYIDVLYIHAPWTDAPWQEAIPQIDELIDEKLVRYFGVSNFNLAQMKQASAMSSHAITVNQMNYNVLNQSEVSLRFRRYCEDQNIQIVAYQPIKRRAVLADQVVQAVAQAHHATAAQVALAWLIHMRALPIPKSVTKAHIDENLGALHVKLAGEEMERLTEHGAKV